MIPISGIISTRNVFAFLKRKFCEIFLFSLGESSPSSLILIYTIFYTAINKKKPYIFSVTNNDDDNDLILNLKKVKALNAPFKKFFF